MAETDEGAIKVTVFIIIALILEKFFCDTLEQLMGVNAILMFAIAFYIPAWKLFIPRPPTRNIHH